MRYYFFLFFLFSCNKKESTISKNYSIEEKNAITLAEKEWLNAYGSSIYDEKPYNIKKKNDSIFIVYGTFNKTGMGGVAYAEVNVKTKKVIKYTHGE